MKSLCAALVIGMITHTNALAKAPVNLCLTGKIQSTLPTYKIAFLNGIYLAANESAYKNIHFKTYFYDSKPLSPIKAYEEMTHDNCSAIIGYEYLSDLLLVIKIQKNSQVPIFTSYASSNIHDKFPKTIRLMSLIFS